MKSGFLFLMIIVFLKLCNQKDYNTKYDNQVNPFIEFEVEAPNEVYSFLKNNINEHELNKIEYINGANVGITIADSIIEDCSVYFFQLNDKGKIISFTKDSLNIIKSAFLNRQVNFTFIDDYRFSSYSFRIDISKLVEQYD